MSRAARKALEQPRQDGRWLAFEHPAQEVDVLGEAGVDRTQFLDLLHRVHDRRVVAAAEFTADLGQRAGGELLPRLAETPRVPEAELQNDNRSSITTAVRRRASLWIRRRLAMPERSCPNKMSGAKRFAGSHAQSLTCLLF